MISKINESNKFKRNTINTELLFDLLYNVQIALQDRGNFSWALLNVLSSYSILNRSQNAWMLSQDKRKSNIKRSLLYS